ncbi:DUF1761 domain-containing protein [Thalassotalea sp. LPB0316]|uniref:DUF1761 domain-containing protein n=1 Tax=Thalassotalea sp. LPB0316 TaxID=2769490 RepID=UPI001865ED2C|nr:DUF1761 domain-containing protein [Thalassotalea sp. LPB0316]QOL24735.1 DUF1761 domain-containing protein [Thalassotalea sp. LPB0316]
MFEVNYLAVIVAAVSSFILGGLWYSPALFGKAWMREANFDENQAGHPAKVFGFAFLFSFIAALCFASLVGPAPELMVAIHYALIVGIGFVAMSFGVNYQFSNKSWTLLFIDSGYHLGQFLLFALVYAFWPQ